MLPEVGLLAHVGHAGVDGDVHVGAARHVDGGTAAIVVVGHLGSAAPLHVHLRALDGLHPGAAEVARALADLPGLDVVRRLEHVLQNGLGMHAPDAGRAHLAGDGLAAVLVRDLPQVVHDGVERLVPGDAHPAGLLALGVRALHGVVQTIGVVGRLDGRLRLGAAVAHGLPRALVALDANGAAVLDDDLDAALHLAASAAAGLHHYRVVPDDLGVRGFGKGGGRLGTERGRGSGRDGRSLHERATGHCQRLAHLFLLLSTLLYLRTLIARALAGRRASTVTGTVQRLGGPAPRHDEKVMLARHGEHRRNPFECLVPHHENL